MSDNSRYEITITPEGLRVTVWDKEQGKLLSDGPSFTTKGREAAQALAAKKIVKWENNFVKIEV